MPGAEKKTEEKGSIYNLSSDEESFFLDFYYIFEIFHKI